jgi:hypothetical protein
MPDICMCVAKNCPVAERCYRHPKPGTKMEPLQTYSTFEPGKGADCEGFWPTVYKPIVYKRAVVKFNGGRGALLCNRCRIIVATGNGTHDDVEHYCVECKGGGNAKDSG